jgi:putative addiction module killer protein
VQGLRSVAGSGSQPDPQAIFHRGHLCVTIGRRDHARRGVRARGRVDTFKEWFDLLDPAAAAKVAAAQTRLSQGNTSSVKWFAGLGEYVIDWGPGYRVYLARDGENLIVLFGGGTKQRQQRDINRAKELLAEYKMRKAKLKREKPGEQRRRKKR